MPKLSPSQQRVLSQMQAGAKAYFVNSHSDGYWFLSVPGHPGITRQMTVLIKRGLVRVQDGKYNRSVATIAPSSTIDGECDD